MSDDRDVDFSELDRLPKTTESEASNDEDEDSRSSSDPSFSGEIEKIRTELDDLNDKHLRLLAEFDNYKKRALKERSELLKYQGEGLLRDILEVVDNLERAIQFGDKDPSSLKDGLGLTLKSFVETLQRWDVKSQSTVGKPFDPNIQSAISRVPGQDVDTDTVIEELKKPYFYKDKLLRAGEAVVAAPAAASAEDSEEEDS